MAASPYYNRLAAREKDPGGAPRRFGPENGC